MRADYPAVGLQPYFTVPLGELTCQCSIAHTYGQKRSQGYVNPESFTHGTSEQRSYWLRRGLQTGRLDQCDTLRAESIDRK